MEKTTEHRGSPDLTLAQAGDEAAFSRLVAPLRRELRAHCYRMTGALHDADDLVQEALVKAWKGLPQFAQRSSLRTWLHAITTRVCLDALAERRGRSLPMALLDDARPSVSAGVDDVPWLEPCDAALYDLGASASPEQRAKEKESVSLAFLVALQTLPAKQRAALLLFDVLGFEAGECAELLDTSVASVNSALQRARTAVDAGTARAGKRPARGRGRSADVEVDEAVLRRYVDAWQQADVSLLVSLLADDATAEMPPLSTWARGPQQIGALLGGVLSPDTRGRIRLVATEANGLPAFLALVQDAGGAWQPKALHLVELDDDGKICALTAFADPRSFSSWTPATR